MEKIERGKKTKTLFPYNLHHFAKWSVDCLRNVSIYSRVTCHYCWLKRMPPRLHCWYWCIFLFIVNTNRRSPGSSVHHKEEIQVLLCCCCTFSLSLSLNKLTRSFSSQYCSLNSAVVTNGCVCSRLDLFSPVHTHSSDWNAALLFFFFASSLGTLDSVTCLRARPGLGKAVQSAQVCFCSELHID